MGEGYVIQKPIWKKMFPQPKAKYHMSKNVNDTVIYFSFLLLSNSSNFII